MSSMKSKLYPVHTDYVPNKDNTRGVELRNRLFALHRLKNEVSKEITELLNVEGK